MKTIACAMDTHNVCSSYVILWTGELAGRGKKYHDDCTCDCHEKNQQEKPKKIEISEQRNLL